MPKGKKTRNSGVLCTPQQKELRLEEAVDWLRKNPDARYTDFLNYFKPKWDLLRNQVSIYRREALEKLAEDVSAKILAKKELAQLGLKNMLRKAQAEGDLAMELKIRQEINKVSGVHTTNYDVTSDGDKIEGFNIKDLLSFNNDQNEESED